MKTIATVFTFKITRLGSENLEIGSWPFELTFDFKSIKHIDPNFSLKVINQEIIDDIPWCNPNDNRDRGTIELYKYEISTDTAKDIVFNYTFQQWCPFRKQVVFDQCLLTRDSINGSIEALLYDSFAHHKSVITSNNAYRYDFTKETDQWKFLKWVTKYYKQVSHTHDKHWQYALGTLENYAIDKLHDSIKEDNSSKLKTLPYEGKKLVNFNELSEYGLIWKINKDILHPLGLALARNTDGTSNGCMVASDGVWEYDADADKRNLEKYDNFLNLLK